MHPRLCAAERTIAFCSEPMHVLATSKVISNYKYEKSLLTNAKKIEPKRQLQSARAKACVDPHEKAGAERFGTRH